MGNVKCANEPWDRGLILKHTKNRVRSTDPRRKIVFDMCLCFGIAKISARIVGKLMPMIGHKSGIETEASPCDHGAAGCRPRWPPCSVCPWKRRPPSSWGDGGPPSVGKGEGKGTGLGITEDRIEDENVRHKVYNPGIGCKMPPFKSLEMRK